MCASPCAFGAAAVSAEGCGCALELGAEAAAAAAGGEAGVEDSATGSREMLAWGGKGGCVLCV